MEYPPMVAHNPVRLRARNVSESVTGSELFLPFLARLDTSFARKVRKAYVEGRHWELLNFPMPDPKSYTNPDLFSRDYAAYNLLRKFPGLDLGDTHWPAAVALEKFWESESLCKQTNNRLSRPLLGEKLNAITTPGLLFAAQEKIARLLGPFSWSLVERGFGFSSGASVRLRRSMGDPYYKLSGKPTVTRRAGLAALAAIHSSPSWRSVMHEQYGVESDPFTWLEVVPGARLDTVEKNAKTDRCICIEPDMNMYLQKGFGSYIRSRLKSITWKAAGDKPVFVDLNNQVNNQRFAQSGSVDGSLATIDLSAASDSVSTGLVESLLPREWFLALDLVRSEFVSADGGPAIRLEKFSSMGNGFTFELESLIFWALASACVDLCSDQRLAVYGDDIIVPSAASGTLIELLSYCGFKTNADKTFVDGPFRESCGKHYFRGVDVTPLLIDDLINNVGRKYWFANSIRRYAARATGTEADPRYYASWCLVVNSIPTRLRRWIPEGIGDGGLIGTFSECLPFRRRSMWCVKIRHEITHDVTTVFDSIAYVRTALDGYPTPGTCIGEGESVGLTTSLYVKRRKPRWLVVTIETSQWVDAPIWCI